MSLPAEVGVENERYPNYLSATCNPNFLSMQDSRHMLAKALRALMLKELKIGKAVASRSMVISANKQLGKPITNLTESQLSNNKDRMDHTIAAKLSEPSFTDHLKRPKEQGTRAYLIYISHIKNAYITEASTPNERLYSAWYTAAFVRFWKFFLKAEIGVRADLQDVIHPTLQANFISTNLEICTEINAASLQLFHDQCRDLQEPERFLPTLLSSQGCEDSFRKLRSTSTTGSTVINVDMLGALERMTRIDILSSAPEGFLTREKKEKELYIPKKLAGDDEVKSIMERAFTDVKGVFESLSK